MAYERFKKKAREWSQPILETEIQKRKRDLIALSSPKFRMSQPGGMAPLAVTRKKPGEPVKTIKNLKKEIAILSTYLSQKINRMALKNG